MSDQDIVDHPRMKCEKVRITDLAMIAAYGDKPRFEDWVPKEE